MKTKDLLLVYAGIFIILITIIVGVLICKTEIGSLAAISLSAYTTPTAVLLS